MFFCFFFYLKAMQWYTTSSLVLKSVKIGGWRMFKRQKKHRTLGKTWFHLLQSKDDGSFPIELRKIWGKHCSTLEVKS